MKNWINFSLAFLFILFNSFSAYSQSMSKQFDELLNETFPKDGPGASAIVTKEGKTIYHKAFGMADLELDVAMEPNMIFEIGSVSKQFTAVAILMLVEQGKVKLEDDITEYIEDYPTHGHRITVHHLLNHTSGIVNYTDLASWQAVWRLDKTPKEMIDIFKNEPMDFAPGEEWKYSNSGYILLGYIVEVASGMSYEDFVEQNIFKPLGMNSSLYGAMDEIIKNRAKGYMPEQDGVVNAEYLSMSQPYAAGSIMSTVEDLSIWNNAIRDNKLISEETKKLAFTNYKLNNGDYTNYGYGWQINQLNGSVDYEHSGGIFGFLSNGIYLPEEDVYVAVLSNCNCNDPIMVSTKMAAIAIGKPFASQKKEISIPESELEKLVGVYEFEDGATRIITLEDKKLLSQRPGSQKFVLHPTAKYSFYFENSFAEIDFKVDEDPVKANFTRRGDPTSGYKTDKTIPTRNEVDVDENSLQQYTGVYNLAPNFNMTITVEDGKLMSQATGQDKFQIYPEGKNKFFYKVVDAQIEFIENEEGEFDSFILYQGGQEIPGKKKN